MGAELMKQVIVEHADVPERSFKVLMRMAATALDRRGSKGQPAELYFAGWEPLGMALGRHVPTLEEAQQDPVAAKERDRVKETVRRAVADLVKRGLVTTVGRAHTGSRQTYRLTLRGTGGVALSTVLSNPDVPLDDLVLTDQEGHRDGGAVVTEKGAAEGTRGAPSKGASRGREGHRDGSERGTAAGGRGAPLRGKRGTAAVPPRKEEEVGRTEERRDDSPTVSTSRCARADDDNPSDPAVRERTIADTRAQLRAMNGGRSA